MLFIHICILDSYVNLCQNQSCQFPTSAIMLILNFYCHVNVKLLWSHQYQTSTVLSISSSCSHVSPFQFVFAIQFVPVNGQVASSHPRTASACQFILVIGQVTSSHPRTACACQFIFVVGQVTSSHPRTACTCRFAFILVIGQVASSNTRTACTYALCVCYQPNGQFKYKNSLCSSPCQ